MKAFLLKSKKTFSLTEAEDESIYIEDVNVTEQEENQYMTEDHGTERSCKSHGIQGRLSPRYMFRRLRNRKMFPITKMYKESFTTQVQENVLSDREPKDDSEAL